MPNVKALLLNATPLHLRGVAGGVSAFIDEVGRGAGPWVVSRLVVQMHGRTGAFALAFLIWGASSVFLLGLICTSKRDEERVHASVLEHHRRDFSSIDDADADSGDNGRPDDDGGASEYKGRPLAAPL